MSDSSTPYRETQVGSPDAAQDLYGLGVRIGFYLQALGMFLYIYCGKEDHAKGLKLASGSIAFSILVSWFGFATREAFSPSEAIIVLLILMSLGLQAKVTLWKPRTIFGEIVGVAVMLAYELGACGALLWTFARLVSTLPLLGTENVAFFFARVALDGWFRYLALVVCVIDAITSLEFAYHVIRVMKIAWEHYCSGTEPSQASLDQVERIMLSTHVEALMIKRLEKMGESREEAMEFIQWMKQGIKKYMFPCMSCVAWIFTVVALELNIRWNHLSPSNNFLTPGQLIPLLTGIIIFIDSCLVAGRPLLLFLSRHRRS